MKASDLLVQCLENEGIEYVFGVPGEENADFLLSLEQSAIEFVITRHEQGAAFMAESGVQYVIGNPYIMENTNPYGPVLEGHLELYTKYFPPYSSRKFVWKFIP